jgi:hypothetical protein
LAKEDLLAEAAALGIEGLDETFTNKMIQSQIDAVLMPGTTPEEPQLEFVAEEVAEGEAVPVAAEQVFTHAQLKPYVEQMFGVGVQVFVGAASAGLIPSKATKAQVAHGIDQYLNMPVKQEKEG